MTSVDAQAGATAEQTETKCPVCPHARDAHDTISTRYCDATVAGDFGDNVSRGCVCGGGPEVV